MMGWEAHSITYKAVIIKAQREIAPDFIFLFYLFFNILLSYFLERGEGKEKERERNINVWLPPAHRLLGDRPGQQPRHVP